MTKTTASPELKHAKIIPRDQHHVSRKQVSDHALKVLYHLNKHGFDAYLVGGCVRDLLMHHQPKDFDIATNALPEEVKKIFGNCRLIGRRFRLAHVYFKSEIIEVATFRAGHEGADQQSAHLRDGMIVRDNVYGDIEEDAFRRDFTVNALFYNIKDFSIVDFTNGFKDLKANKLKIIGDAKVRYREDPVRMIRAIRFAAKLDMKIVSNTAKPLIKMRELLYQVSPSRLFDEMLKLFHTGHAEKVFPLLCHYGLFETLFPLTTQSMKAVKRGMVKKMINHACAETDRRLAIGKSVSSVFLFAVLLWYPVERRCLELQAEGLGPMHAVIEAGREIIHEQNKIVNFPRRFVSSIYEIWQLQYRFSKPQRKNIFRCLDSQRFRAGFDLLLLRSKVDKTLKFSAEWWTEFQKVGDKKRDELIKLLHKD